VNLSTQLRAYAYVDAVVMWLCTVGCAVWCGVVWCGVVWCGVVWCGGVWWGGGGEMRCEDVLWERCELVVTYSGG
jgi:hypothetical protein